MPVQGDSQSTQSGDGWEYGEGTTIVDESRVELREPRVVVSKYVPTIEYDPESNTLSLTTGGE